MIVGRFPLPTLPQVLPVLLLQTFFARFLKSFNNGRASNVLEKFIKFRELFGDVSNLKVSHVELYSTVKYQEMFYDNMHKMS